MSPDRKILFIKKKTQQTSVKTTTIMSSTTSEMKRTMSNSTSTTPDTTTEAMEDTEEVASSEQQNEHHQPSSSTTTTALNLNNDDEDDDEYVPLAEELQDRKFSFGSFQQDAKSSSSSVVPASTHSSPATTTNTTTTAATTKHKHKSSSSSSGSGGETCCVCMQLIKTNKSGSYRSDNFLADYKACFPGFQMVCGPVCYTCYYTCYQFRKKRKDKPHKSNNADDGDEDYTAPRTTRRKKRKYTATVAAEDMDVDEQQGNDSRTKRRRKKSKADNNNASPSSSDAVQLQQQQQQHQYTQQIASNNATYKVKEFDCCCCGKHEQHGKCYAFKQFADSYQVLFPNNAATANTETGDVCRRCYAIGYKFRQWAKENSNTDPNKFVEDFKQLLQGSDDIYIEEELTDRSTSTSGGGNNAKRRKITRGVKQSEEDDDDSNMAEVPVSNPMSQKYEAMKANLSRNAIQIIKTMDEVIEVFIDIRVKAQRDQEHKRSKIIREYIPSRSTRENLLEVAQRYVNIIYPVTTVQSVATTPIVTEEPTALDAATNGTDNHKEQQQQQPLPTRFVVQDIKLAERDSTGVDLEIDLVSDSNLGNNPLKPKSRFIAYCSEQ
jgi:hypothetical protein